MSRQPPIHRSTDVSIAHPRLLDVDAERKKRIDTYIDYFGDGGGRGGGTADPCGESLLDAWLDPDGTS